MEYLEKLSAEDNISGLLYRRGITDLDSIRKLLAIFQKSQELTIDRILFTGNSRTDSFNKPFATSTSLSELHLRRRRFCWYK